MKCITQSQLTHQISLTTIVTALTYSNNAMGSRSNANLFVTFKKLKLREAAWLVTDRGGGMEAWGRSFVIWTWIFLNYLPFDPNYNYCWYAARFYLVLFMWRISRDWKLTRVYTILVIKTSIKVSRVFVTVFEMYFLSCS